MVEIEGDFGGELKFDPIKYSKILMKVVTKNNPTSGKITVPLEFIDKKVIILFPNTVSKQRMKK